MTEVDIYIHTIQNTSCMPDMIIHNNMICVITLVIIWLTTQTGNVEIWLLVIIALLVQDILIVWMKISLKLNWKRWVYEKR